MLCKSLLLATSLPPTASISIPTHPPCAIPCEHHSNASLSLVNAASQQRLPQGTNPPPEPQTVTHFPFEIVVSEIAVQSIIIST